MSEDTLLLDESEGMLQSIIDGFDRVCRKLERVMKGRNISMAVKQGIRNSVILPTLSYASET